MDSSGLHYEKWSTPSDCGMLMATLQAGLHGQCCTPPVPLKKKKPPAIRMSSSRIGPEFRASIPQDHDADFGRLKRTSIDSSQPMSRQKSKQVFANALKPS